MRIITEEERRAHAGVWVLCDLAGGVLQSVTFELLGSATRLAAERQQEVWALLIGQGVENQVHTLWEHGADTVVLVEAPEVGWFNDETLAAITERLIHKYRPEIFLAGASATGRALVPRVAVKAECGLTADCTSLDIEAGTGALLQTRPAFGGTLMATIRSDQFLPQMATIRPGVMKARSPRSGACGRLIREALLAEESKGRKHLLEELLGLSPKSGFGDASFVIAGGRGMKGAEGFKMLEELAALVDGAVGATRAAVDAGWTPYAMQIGQTGRTIQPQVYIACGISGQVQHLVGIQQSDLIIAINRDKEAPIMKMADLAIEGDIFEIIPALMDLIRHHGRPIQKEA